MEPRRLLHALVLVAVAVGVVAAGAPGAPSASPASGFQALSGDAAAAFALPGDVELVRRLELGALGLTYERYQQRYGPARAAVVGGQLTLYRDASGRIRLVVGAHYPSIAPTNRVSVNAAQARERVATEVADHERSAQLLIDPADGRYFWQVESYRIGSRWFHAVDAQGGHVLRRLNAFQTEHGVGVKGDTKSMAGLTRSTAQGWELSSPDDRQTTLDAANSTFFLFQFFDPDNHWLTPGTASPGHPAAVDAQYYSKTTDSYYLSRFGFDWMPCYPPVPFFSGPGMRSGVHYGIAFNNAGWDGRYTLYGDGDGVVFRELSGALDVVAHEHTHGVTDCTSNLVYQNESGALNEAFSDMIGSSAEFFANEPTVPADWGIAEDIYLTADTVPGFRNMADPEEDGDPDHYLERYTGTDDNGGVHTNSGIANHAYWLLVNGGQNASCAAPGSHNAAHCTDADTQDNGLVVTGIGLADAERITFVAYTGLSANATMCDARAAMESTAAALFGAGSQQRLSTTAAYVAVGLTDAQCGIAPPPPTNTAPTAASKTATTTAGTPVAITLSGTDAETCELAFSVVTPPASGSLGSITPSACTPGTPNGDTASVTYTPNGGFSGSDSFTYQVNDGSLGSAPATVSITVSAQPTMHVGDLDRSSVNNGKTWTATVIAQVDTEAHAQVAGALVTGSWSGGATGSATCTTGAGGRCSVSKSLLPKKSATASFTVTNVSLAGRTYVPSANHDPDGDSDGTAITVPKP